jgi:RND superfamily putative drug exporter
VLGLFVQLTNRDIDVPGSGSDRVERILRDDVPSHSGTELFVLMRVRRPGTDPNAEDSIPRAIRRVLGHQPGPRFVRIVGASIEYGRTRAINPPPAVANIMVSFRLKTDPDGAERLVPELRAKLTRASNKRISMTLLGWPALSERYSTVARQDLARSEAITFPVTLSILLVAFLSVIAAVLPLLLAGAALIVTLALLFSIAHGAGLSVFVTNTASVLALGLSIDYSLFIITRVREEMRAGHSVEAAVLQTLATTGRAVVLSGVTLATALLSLFVVGVGLFSSMAIGATLGALVAVLGAVTLVPAIACLLGPRIDVLTVRPFARAAERASAWHTLGRAVVNHPTLAISGSLAILLALAVPVRSLQLGLHTLTALPPNDPVRVAAQRFEPAPVDIVTRDNPDRISRVLSKIHGVREVWPLLGTHGWRGMQTSLEFPPDSAEARMIVHQIRTRLFQQKFDHTYVGGPTALALDLTKRVSTRTPYVVLTTTLLAVLILAVGLRSIIIPIKAVLATLLSVAAALGIVLRIFPASAGNPTLEFFVPLFLFVVIFGLSIDYEVFLLSRIAEVVRSGGSNRDGVVLGLVRSGRPMTLAGVTLATVFLALTSSSFASFRQLGAGIAVAIVLDVTLVRCLLIPAAVVLLGRWNWWFPGNARRH